MGTYDPCNYVEVQAEIKKKKKNIFCNEWTEREQLQPRQFIKNTIWVSATSKYFMFTKIYFFLQKTYQKLYTI